MEAIETATQTEPRMPRGGIGTGRRGVGGGEPETHSSSEDEQPVRCVDRVLELRSAQAKMQSAPCEEHASKETWQNRSGGVGEEWECLVAAAAQQL